MAKELRSVWTPTAPQRAFRRSQALIRGYGGAMGGGKSRAGCEEVLDACLDYPGLVALVARQAHTSIVGTTKKTMLDQVMPPELIDRKKESQGEDWIRLFNGSQIHFIGLDDPIRWYSSEVGFLFFDECQEMSEYTVLRLVTRLRQKVPGNGGFRDAPNRAILTFNPSSPGHWLMGWFLNGEVTPSQEKFDNGTAECLYKKHLIPTDAIEPLGDAFFVFARVTDNPYVGDDYVRKLRGLPEWMRRRYLDGLWEFTEGNLFFDAETLHFQREQIGDRLPLLTGRTEGNIEADLEWRRNASKPQSRPKDTIRLLKGDGPVHVWKLPEKKRTDPTTGRALPPKRYVVSVDTSSGGAFDKSAIQVVSVEDFEQVAEFNGHLQPTELAKHAYRLGRLYNDALVVPEITGGWGVTIQEELRRWNYPNPYTRRMYDRLAKKYTDRLGWDTSVGSRRLMLDNLERVLREKEFKINSQRTMNELATFVYGQDDKPQAQIGCNDDLVIALAIAVTVMLQQPRGLRTVTQTRHTPQFSATGW